MTSETSSRDLGLLLVIPAIAVGVAIAWVDSRPNWDDTGITAMSMAIASGILGLAAPKRPWLWALAIGIWIPLHQIANRPSVSAVLGGCVILLFPMAGAYLGMFCRRAAAAK